MHVDMDAFYPSVEISQMPELKDKPVIVGADPKGGKGRGVVSSCNYAARKLGIHSAMPISQAYKLAPSAVYLPVRMELYLEVSERVLGIIRMYADKFQQLSIDEAFIDVSQKAKDLDEAKFLALKIKEEIKAKEGLTCSIGISVNKSIAKIASDFKKPDGLTIVKESEIKEFLAPLSVRKIMGVGPKTEMRLSEIGIETICQLANYDKLKLAAKFGKWGYYLHLAANGIDDEEVEEDNTVLSIGRETTFEEDTSYKDKLHEAIGTIAEEVYYVLKQNKITFKTVHLKVRLSNFKESIRSKTLQDNVLSLDTIKKIARQLLAEFLGGKAEVRKIGVRVSNLKKIEERQKLVVDY